MLVQTHKHLGIVEYMQTHVDAMKSRAPLVHRHHASCLSRRRVFEGLGEADSTIAPALRLWLEVASGERNASALSACIRRVMMSSNCARVGLSWLGSSTCARVVGVACAWGVSWLASDAGSVLLLPGREWLTGWMGLSDAGASCTGMGDGRWFSVRSECVSCIGVAGCSS